MKRLVDMHGRTGVGTVEWEFLFDLQQIQPKDVTPYTVRVSSNLLSKVPGKWKAERDVLANALGGRESVLLAVADVADPNHEFHLRGILENEQGQPLSLHQVQVFDEDHIEDDFLGVAITDDDGMFEVSFGLEAFQDIPIIGERTPDVLLKVARWNPEGRFEPLEQRRIHDAEARGQAKGKKVIDLGTVQV